MLCSWTAARTRRASKQFGTFASVGATSAQIRRFVLAEAWGIAAVGIPLGVLGASAGVGVLLRSSQLVPR